MPPRPTAANCSAAFGSTPQGEEAAAPESFPPSSEPTIPLSGKKFSPFEAQPFGDSESESPLLSYTDEYWSKVDSACDDLDYEATMEALR